MRGHGDLRIVVWLAWLCALLAFLLPVSVLSLLFAAPLALFLTGYGVTAAIFARRRIEPRQFALFSLGLSLAVLALGALPLNYLPGGIRAGWWTLLLLLVVLGSCRAAALRRPRRYTAPLGRTAPLRVNGAQAALVLLGIAAILAAIVLAFTPLGAKQAIGYTELWIQPATIAGDPGARIGVGSGEREDSSYRLEVEFGNGGSASRELELAPGEKVVVEVVDSGPNAPTAAAPVPVTATLFKQDSATPERPFREVKAWIPAAEESP
ncbi:MAG TPA: DUF1616 domain-containing protein [Solirubrobacterales bacterium]|nr:DUF1616 domain-containing protein [Solirubrobacterales bacterium]